MVRHKENWIESEAIHRMWITTEKKAGKRIKGVWEIREKLPVGVVLDEEGNQCKTTDDRIAIPLFGGGSIKFSQFVSLDPKKAGRHQVNLGIDMHYPTSRGDNDMRESRFLALSSDSQKCGKSFWIYFDDTRDEDQAERIKYLARLNPNKDINWDEIKRDSVQTLFALAMCKYV